MRSLMRLERGLGIIRGCFTRDAEELGFEELILASRKVVLVTLRDFERHVNSNNKQAIKQGTITQQSGLGGGVWSAPDSG